MTQVAIEQFLEKSRRMRASGAVPDDLETTLQAGFRRFVKATPGRRRGEEFRKAVDRTFEQSFISSEATPDSSRRFLGPFIRALKRVIWRMISWSLQPLALRTSKFAEATVEALKVAEDRIEESEHEIVRLSETPRVVRERVEVMWQMWERMGGIRLDERLTRLERTLRYMQQTLDSFRPTSPSSAVPVETRHEVAEPKRRRKLEKVFDYYLFQLAHRGGPEMLDERIRRYLPYFAGVQDVLDFGCGRGEFLEAFRSSGIRAYGVETHPDMVAECRAKSLEVIEGDGMDHLRNLAPGTIGGIFLGQVVEHLDPAELVELVDRSSDALRPGGVFLAETVNPTCLGSFAHAFYIDLSHEKPVHPTTMKFLLESAGFGNVSYEWMFPFPEDVRLSQLPGEERWVSTLNENIQKLNALLWGPHDYAVISRKPK